MCWSMKGRFPKQVLQISSGFNTWWFKAASLRLMQKYCKSNTATNQFCSVICNIAHNGHDGVMVWWLPRCKFWYIFCCSVTITILFWTSFTILPWYFTGILSPLSVTLTHDPSHPLIYLVWPLFLSIFPIPCHLSLVFWVPVLNFSPNNSITCPIALSPLLLLLLTQNRLTLS